jgi:Flp pilus assembly protein TadG
MLKRSFFRYRSKGQTAVVFTLAAATLVGVMGLGADVAELCFNWMLLQKAADAAVLAGANYLPQMPDVAVSTANSYAVNNGVRPAEIVSTQVSSDDQEITITVQRTVPYYFLKVLGLFSGGVSASATAAVPKPAVTVGKSGSGTYGGTVGKFGLIPIGLDYTTPYTPDQPVTLNYGQVGPGNWGSLALGGVGGSNLRTNIANGYSGPVTIGDWVTTEPGVKVGPVDQGFNDRITAAQSQDPSGNYQTHSLTNARIIVIPMVDWGNINGRSQVQVMGFAAMWLDGVSGGQINTHFITQVIPDSLGGPGPVYGANGQPILIK